MYGQDNVLKQASPTNNFEEVAKECANEILKHDPVNQNEIIRIITAIVKEHRQQNIKDATTQMDYLKRSWDELTGGPAVSLAKNY